MRLVLVLVVGALVGACDLRPFTFTDTDAGLHAGDGGDDAALARDVGPRDGIVVLDSGEVCVPQPEVCNGRDDDCNGIVDDVANLDSDPNNCGQCGRACVLPHTNGACVAGECVFSCQTGWFDANADLAHGLGASDGCECVQTHGGVEVCDGEDNDCDGVVDNPPAGQQLPEVGDPCYPATGCDPSAGTCKGECRAGVKECVAGALVCQGAVGPQPEACDGLDNDCNGQTDDGLIPRPCYTAATGCDVATGACLGTCRLGLHTCLGAAGWSTCEGEVGPTAETCDGQDNDCNGATDDGALPGVGATCYPAHGCDPSSGTCQGSCHPGTTQCVNGGLACAGAQEPTLEQCDDLDHDCDGVKHNGFDLQTDVHNCGTCGNDCTSLALHPESRNAWAYCEAGQCKRTCKVGWWDVNDDFDGVGPVDGCEYRCDYTGPEVCDGVDNDCNGETDTADPGLLVPGAGFCLQQGACAGSQPECTRYGPAALTESGDDADQLDQWVVTGASDQNTAAGVLFVTLTEASGTVTVSLYADQALASLVARGARSGDGTVAIAAQNGSGLSGSVRVAFTQPDLTITLAVPITTWVCNYGPDVEVTGLNQVAAHETRCDGIDNDCDGQTDEDFPRKGTVCDNGLLGVCRGTGHYFCTADRTTTECVIEVPGAAPGPEVCDGLDNDCDGLTDEPKASPGTSPSYVVDDMVEIGTPDGGLHFWIYRYEASRPGATATDPGALAGRACSRAEVLPWTLVSYANAAAACAAAGKRLCTKAEYDLACGGAAGATYPYGDSYDPTACNGSTYDLVPDGGVPDGGRGDAAVTGLIPGGAAAACETPLGVYDLSGNAKEWTTERGDTWDGGVGRTDAGVPIHIYVVRGGAYDTPAPGLTCDFEWSREVETVLLPTLGFRCCSDAAP